MLHTVNKSPFDKNSLKTCLSHSLKDSDILLIEDGVYGAIKDSAMSGDIEKALTDRKIYVLESDIKARGIDSSRLVQGVAIVDYGGFVELAASNDRVQSWL
ncbi:MAG: multidrug MFS transporter [marine bacterium B5-7]|nr:MAG: multidrug MFS transporter [marine bacterium B5-7]